MKHAPAAFALFLLALLHLMPAGSAMAQGEGAELQVLSLQFSGTRAMRLVEHQVAMGPRVPGSIPHAHTRQLIRRELAPYVDRIEEQSFYWGEGASRVPMTNVVGYLHPEASQLALVAAHYDTRPFGERDTGNRRDLAIPGANDGASGVAVLLELARVLAGQLPADRGVVFIFFDGEDYTLSLTTMFIGSRHFAQNLDPTLKARLDFGVVLDMVGDRGLRILRESHSEAVAHRVFQALLELQEALGLNVLSGTTTITVFDDHLPLNAEGLRVYDLIDFTYDPWHTQEDTPDKCSAQSLQAVGLLVENLLLNFAAGSFSLRMSQ